MPLTCLPSDIARAEQVNRPALSALIGDGSPWQPLTHPLYRALWLASIASNTGAYMQDVAAVWTLTELSTSPFVISLKQVASSVPLVLLALPAGAMADTMDRRKLLLWAQAGGLVSVAALAILGWLGLLTPTLILLLTFTLAGAVALYTPTAQASLGEWLPRPEVPRGVTLNNVSVSLGRAAGPLLGGLVVAQVGPWAVFALNALAFVATAVIVYRWKRQPSLNTLPPQPIQGAVVSGIRYVKNAPALRTALTRAAVLLLPASAFWALLPVWLREGLRLDSLAFGGAFAALGLGAVVGAAALPQLRKWLSTDQLVAIATSVLGGVLLLLPLSRSYAAVLLSTFLAGVAWIGSVPVLAAAAGAGAPGWFKGRALATFTLVSQLAAVIGSPLWGLVALNWGTPTALQGSALLLFAGLPVGLWMRLARGECLDLSPSETRAEPRLTQGLSIRQGAVMVQVVYIIDPEQAAAFQDAMDGVRLERYREGATYWSLFQDLEDASRFVEVYLADSWLDHLRAHAQVTVSDRDVEMRVLAFHRAPEPPKVSHLIARHPSRGARR